MKNLYSILLVLISFNLFANNPIVGDGEKGSLILNNEFVTLSIEKHKDLERLRYDKENEQLVINCNTTLLKVTIKDKDGKLYYQIPLKSKKLRLSMDLFEDARYQLVFDLEDNSSMTGNIEIRD